MRCFLALDPAPETREALAEAQRAMAEARLPLRFTPPDAMHLTIKFIDEIDEATATGIIAALEQKLRRFSVPTARLVGLGAFPSPQRARAVFAGVGAGREAVVALMQEVEEAVALLGVAREERPRVPHMTIARCKHAVPRRLGSFIAERQATDWGPVPGTPLILYRSVLRPSGSEYTPLASVAL